MTRIGFEWQFKTGVLAMKDARDMAGAPLALPSKSLVFRDGATGVNIESDSGEDRFGQGGGVALEVGEGDPVAAFDADVVETGHDECLQLGLGGLVVEDERELVDHGFPTHVVSVSLDERADQHARQRLAVRRGRVRR